MKSKSMDAIERNNCHLGRCLGDSECHRPVLWLLAGVLGALSPACGDTVDGDQENAAPGTDTAVDTDADIASFPL